VEPDVVFLSHHSIESGRVRLVPKTSAEPDRYVELEGPPDLIVEIVSDSSVTKDTRRLPAAYWRAGVEEFWLVDARGETLLFQIHRRGRSAYEAILPDADGFQYSAVFETRFRLTRRRNEHGRWVFDLEERHT
jgi:Uma2 family endonuclease